MRIAKPIAVQVQSLVRQIGSDPLICDTLKATHHIGIRGSFLLFVLLIPHANIILALFLSPTSSLDVTQTRGH